MCTVTVIQLEGGGFRLVTNRDESPDRPAASLPEWHEGVGGGDIRAIWPTDGLAGGTWVAAGEQGLTLTLLNGNLGNRAILPDPTRRQSRGILIPRLIGSPDALTAHKALSGFELDRFDPFRLVAADAAAGLRIVESFWDGRSLQTTDLGPGPACFASSGLGDEQVQPRIPLFAELVVAAGATPAAQDRFHRHQWPDRLEISVLMERAEARTVSITGVEVKPVDGGRLAVSMVNELVGTGSF
ncbi:hypothetical protein MNBD_PLANCTO03-2192 [hydrothermal vent metagenome]|uniref:COG3332 n=1 Tax=hydrothermal vent metagenome TaxID=652676 RepID=A0A3B1E1H1_9ZZZZ